MNIPVKITPDFAAVKTKQQAAWSSGDYAVVGTTLQIVGERLVEAVDINSNHRVLDVAAGNGNASLAAARHFAEVVSTDYVPELLSRGRERAQAERLDISFQEADAENLPFKNDNFDIVLSTFGVMFTPDHEKAANEMIRVVKRGGKIGLANWTPESYIGQVFKTIGKYVTPPAGVQSPALWGATAHIDALFGEQASSIKTEKRHFVFRYHSPQHIVDIFRTFYGPVLKAFGALDAQKQQALEQDFLALIARFNRADDGSVVLPSEYLEIVVTKK
jgi:ubiquinone/menaquinone biosynthesis C-methylase UbiE